MERQRNSGQVKRLVIIFNTFSKYIASNVVSMAQNISYCNNMQ
jgi:hypothetical protein